jgi:hypothetical protein
VVLTIETGRIAPIGNLFEKCGGPLGAAAGENISIDHATKLAGEGRFRRKRNGFGWLVWPLGLRWARLHCRMSVSYGANAPALIMQTAIYRQDFEGS